MLPAKFMKSFTEIVQEIKRLADNQELFPNQKIAERFFKDVVPNLMKVVKLVDGLDKLTRGLPVPGLNAPGPGIGESGERWDEVLVPKPKPREEKWVELKVTRRRPLVSCTICMGETFVIHYSKNWWDELGRKPKGFASKHSVLTADYQRPHDACRKCHDQRFKTGFFGDELKKECYWCKKSGVIKYHQEKKVQSGRNKSTPGLNGSRTALPKRREMNVSSSSVSRLLLACF